MPHHWLCFYTRGHLGQDKTLEKVSSRFHWEGMSNDIRNYIKSCDVCQRTNDAKFVKAGYELHPIPVKPVVWNMVSSVAVRQLYLLVIFKVGIDMIRKLPKTADGNQYIVTLMVYSSKLPEAKAVKSKSAETVAMFLYKVICQYVHKLHVLFLLLLNLIYLLIYRFGAPQHIISDQGRKFC